jgi:uncharacterized protein YdeI (YjbR/CyaY-like superfamily)
MITTVDGYLTDGCMRCDLGGTLDCKVLKWTAELNLLRSIVLDTGLNEEVKWGVPCYTHDGNNVLIVSALKDHCSVGFFKGSLLEDSDELLKSPGKNSQAVRLFTFTNVSEIAAAEDIIKAYVFEAIDIEKAGLKVEFKKNPEPMPEELIERLDEDVVFRNAFEALTPGRQRGYILHFSQPKQEKTPLARIEKWTERILNGEGMHDKYKARKK